VPRVSVIMPVYNTARFLPKAIESILAQTYTDYEFIIIDDGSTDNSLEIISQYAKKDARIRYSSRENRGISITRQEGLAMACGELFAPMDSDDVSAPTRLERQVNYLDEHLDCVCVGTFMLLIDPDGDPIGPMEKYTTHEEIDEAHMRGKAGALAHSTALMRLDAVRDVGGYRPGFVTAEDFGRLASISEVLYDYRLHENSICHVSSRMGTDGRRALSDAHRRRGIEKELPEMPDQEAQVQNLANAYYGRSWGALQCGNTRTARKYAWKALRKAPFDIKSYGMLLRVLRGRTRAPQDKA